MDRAKLIQMSLRIFAYGLASLIQVIGFIPAVYAVVGGVRLGRRARDHWNPASGYTGWGIALGLLSLGINLLAALILAFQLLPPYVPQ